MQKYFENSIISDIVFAIILGLLIYYSRPYVHDFIQLPKIETVNNFNLSMLSISATLMGFLLTIITVIVTFKNSFKEKDTDKKITASSDIEAYELPKETVFEKKYNKENTFYKTPVHRAVVNVFTTATYKVTLVIFCLLAIQFNIIYFSILFVAIINFCIFTILILTLGRSLYIFHLFLNVHIHKD